MVERLDRERVVRAALGLLDDVGLDGLSLRRLAAELGVKAPALYWHFASKADLLDEMAATMVRDLVDGAAWDEAHSEPWQQCVRESADALRAMLLAYRDGSRVFSGTLVADPRLADVLRLPISVLTAAGFAHDDAERAWQTLLSLVLGFVVEEQAVAGRQALVAESTESAMDTAGAAGGVGGVGSARVDERFVFGIDVMVAGFETVLARGFAVRPAPTGSMLG